jgi:hypothetical protein
LNILDANPLSWHETLYLNGDKGRDSNQSQSAVQRAVCCFLGLSFGIAIWFKPSQVDHSDLKPCHREGCKPVTGGI